MITGYTLEKTIKGTVFHAQTDSKTFKDAIEDAKAWNTEIKELGFGTEQKSSAPPKKPANGATDKQQKACYAIAKGNDMYDDDTGHVVDLDLGIDCQTRQLTFDQARKFMDKHGKNSKSPKPGPNGEDF